MDKGMVSVVMPIYNQEKYLGRAIPSLLEQSYRHLQLILVNDGSTDGSGSIIAEYENQDARIVVVNKENGGLVSATIAGIAAASGEYICFVDADDYVGSDYISFYLDEMETELDFVASGLYSDSGTKCELLLTETRIYDAEEIQKYRGKLITEDYELELSRRFYVSRCNKLYRTDLVKDVAGEFSKYQDISMGEDSIFTYLLLLRSKKCKSVSKANTYYYNVSNDDSMSHNHNYDQFLAVNQRTYEVFCPLLEMNGDDALQALVLYYLQLNTRLHSLTFADRQSFCNYYTFLKRDELYCKALKTLPRHTKRRKDKLQLFFLKGSSTGFGYYYSIHAYRFLKTFIMKLLQRDG